MIRANIVLSEEEEVAGQDAAADRVVERLRAAGGVEAVDAGRRVHGVGAVAVAQAVVARHVRRHLSVERKKEKQSNNKEEPFVSNRRRLGFTEFYWVLLGTSHAFSTE